MKSEDVIRSDNYRNAIVCIDSCEAGTFQGCFVHPLLEEPEPFRSLTELFRKLDRILNAANFPEAALELRSFREISKSEKISVDIADVSMQRFHLENLKGQKGTFYLRIFFRQNASWQGTVLWMEHRETISFRSAFELMHLLDSALDMQ